MSKNIQWKESSFDYEKLNELTHQKLVASNVAKSLYSRSKEKGHDIAKLAKNKSDEWKRKISTSQQGKIVSDETRENISKAVSEAISNMTKEERKLKYGSKTEEQLQQCKKLGKLKKSEETRKKNTTGLWCSRGITICL